MCPSPAGRGPVAIWQAAAAQDKEALGQTKLRHALGRQIHIDVCSTALLKLGNSTPAPSYAPSRFLVLKTSIYRDAALSFPMLATATSCIKLLQLALQLSPCFSSPSAAVDNSRENRPNYNSGPLARRQFSRWVHLCKGTRRASNQLIWAPKRRNSPCLQMQSRTKQHLSCKTRNESQ